MAEMTIVYWRDIPAQVTVKQGRAVAKRELSPRFAEAIDRAAMRTGARDDESYLAEWRRGAPAPVDAEPEAALAAEIARIEAEFDDARLARLVKAGGREA